MVMASPTSLYLLTKVNVNSMLNNIPIISEIKISRSLESAFNIWNPKILERLTIKINGEEVKIDFTFVLTDKEWVIKETRIFED